MDFTESVRALRLFCRVASFLILFSSPSEMSGAEAISDADFKFREAIIALSADETLKNELLLYYSAEVCGTKLKAEILSCVNLSRITEAEAMFSETSDELCPAPFR